MCWRDMQRRGRARARRSFDRLTQRGIGIAGMILQRSMDGPATARPRTTASLRVGQPRDSGGLLNVRDYETEYARPTPDARRRGRQRHGRATASARSWPRATPTRRFAVTCIGEEPRPAYDRVHLSEFFAGRTADDLQLADRRLVRASAASTLRLGERVVAIDRAARAVATDARRTRARTTRSSSRPARRRSCRRSRASSWPGVFVYRTIEDLEAIRAWGATARGARR